MILHNATAQYEAMTPPEPAHADERFYRALCFDTLETAIESLRASEQTHERHVPADVRAMDAPEYRARYEQLIDLLEEMQSEFTDGGRLYGNNGAG